MLVANTKAEVLTPDNAAASSKIALTSTGTRISNRASFRDGGREVHRVLPPLPRLRSFFTARISSVRVNPLAGAAGQDLTDSRFFPFRVADDPPPGAFGAGDRAATAASSAFSPPFARPTRAAD